METNQQDRESVLQYVLKFQGYLEITIQIYVEKNALLILGEIK